MFVNSEFAGNFLPFHKRGAELDQVIEAMKKEDGMTNPKPARTFSVARNKCHFPRGVRIPDEISRCLEIVPTTYHPFFVIEGSSYEGSELAAENQACRGGAALVHAARIIRHLLGEPDVEGADERTFVFSLTLSPSLVNIWVHWAEVQSGITVFHMTKLHGKVLDDGEHFAQIRRATCNILEWGCEAQVEGLHSLHQRIIEYATKKKAEAPRKKQKTGEPVR